MNQKEQAEDKQSKQEQLALFSRQEAILVAVPDVIIMEMDNHKIYTWANQAGLAFFGDDVIGKEAAFYFVGEQTDSTVVQSPLDGRQELIRVRSWQRRRDGEKRLLAWQERVLRDESGNVTNVLSSARDITEQQREEERLQQIEERWLAISESTQDAILMMDPEGRVFYWNSAAERIFGHTEAEAIGQNLHDLIAPARFHPAFRTAFQKFQQTGQGSAVGRILALEAIRKDGHEISVQLSLSAVQINDGWHALGLIHDITERKLVEEALKESAFFMNRLLETIPIPVFYKDREGRYLGFNKTFETFFGKSKDELIGKSVFDVNPAELAEVYHAQDCQLFGNPAVQVYDSQVRDAHGVMHDVVFHKASLTDTQGAITGLVGAILDVTKRKHAEEELQRYSAELAKKNKELQEALSDIKQLTGMLPICSSCKKIRDDKGYWQGVEAYITKHSEALFSHGICPECEKKMYEDLEELKNEKI